MTSPCPDTRFSRFFRSRRLLSGGACAGLISTIVLTACGSSGTAAGATADYRVAVLSVGTRTDGGFGQAWAEAADVATRDARAGVEWVGGLDTPNQYLAQGSSYATSGYDLVFLAHGAMLPVGTQLAERFPNTRFCVAPIPEAPRESVPANLCVVDAKQEIGAFRAGMLAGLVTTTDVVAANQSLPIPAINRQIEAYRLGAECVNPDVKVLTVVTNNDTDPSVTRTASESQIGANADVLMGATGTAMPGMFEAAKQRSGTYAIGQYVDSTAVAPSVVLASNVVNFQQILPLVVADAKKGDLPPFTAYGLDASVPVGYLALNKELYAKLPPKVRTANDQAQERLTSGRIKLPPTSDIDETGDAAKIDLRSLGCEPSR